MTNCHPDEPLSILFIHYFSSIFSIPVYGITLSVLIFKCPKHFDKKYRFNLVFHIITGILLEIHMSIFWRVSMALPVPIFCSHGLLSSYPATNIQTAVFILIFTGISAVTILIHRMRAVILYADQDKFQNIPIVFRNIFWVFCVISFFLNFMIRDGLNNQTEYKSRMETRFGTFPEYFWCPNCTFMVLDSVIFIVFFITAYISITSAILSAGFSAFVTYRILHSTSLRLSKKTAAIQKNLLWSVIAAFIVHVIFLFIPLVSYVLAHFIYIDSYFFAFICISMIQEHGTFSTATFLLTSNFLRKAAKEFIFIPKKCVVEGRAFQITPNGNPSDN